jgi:hypothetical protein
MPIAIFHLSNMTVRVFALVPDGKLRLTFKGPLIALAMN